MVKPPKRPGGGLLIFSSDAHQEAYINERARVLVQEKLRDHIRALGLTPEGEAKEWAALTIALASVSSRKEIGRRRKARAGDRRSGGRHA
jgi:hypothetical protein